MAYMIYKCCCFLSFLAITTSATPELDYGNIVDRLNALEEAQRLAVAERDALKSKIAELESNLQFETKRNDELKRKLLRQAEVQEKTGDALNKQQHFSTMLLLKLQNYAKHTGELKLRMKSAEILSSALADRVSDAEKEARLSRNIAEKHLDRRQTTADPAFTVYLSSDKTLGAGQPIPFDAILTNDGNGYNVHTSAFTCFKAGLYLFVYFIGDNHSGELQAFLEINSINYVDAALQPYSNGYELQGGNALVRRLNVGDVVMVKASAGSRVEGSTILRTTAFTGVFLHA